MPNSYFTSIPLLVIDERKAKIEFILICAGFATGFFILGVVISLVINHYNSYSFKKNRPTLYKFD